jgi:hypothetical protein
MSLLDLIKQDLKQISSNDSDFAVPATFVSTSGETITINVIHAKRNLTVESEGIPVNAKKANLSFYEGLMVGYTLRNPTTGEVNMYGHKVTVKDSTGNNVTYIIREAYPDETLGLISCILGDLE